MAEPLLLPPPRRRERETFILPIPLYNGRARFQLPEDMTEAEARKLANVILAYGKLTPFNARRA